MTDKNKLADKNMGLVHACCKRFSGKGIEYEELFVSDSQRRLITLTKAVTCSFQPMPFL